jgi:8-oxo-dGTP diphosphatase
VADGTSTPTEPPIDLAIWALVNVDRRAQRLVVVGAAIIQAGQVLACARTGPPAVAGRWEFPGGKVEPGETEEEALVRECVEELGVRVEVDGRVGGDVPLGKRRAVLRVYAARLIDGQEPMPLAHAELRWLTVEELDSVPWLPADVPIVPAVRSLLEG